MSSVACAARMSSGETENALRYRCIIDAVRLINKNKQRVHDEEDLGFSVSPAWCLLNNAANHLLQQAHSLLRGEDER